MFLQITNFYLADSWLLEKVNLYFLVQELDCRHYDHNFDEIVEI